ncbi:maltosaccharide ABC transporter, permease protein [freshwater metagenome]|uniref:Maltosaccharide ABC transporter, permease protein n=1 Tax=freshwater metagenome TaxID=449393 RepID=A0A094Q5J9_9ZZZZ
MTTSTPSKARHPKARRGGFVKWFMTFGWKHLVGLMVVAFSTFPLLYILSTSLTKMGNIENYSLFRQFYLGNYHDLLTSTDYPFVTWMKNTLILAGATAVISVFISALAAFAFSRLRFNGRRTGLLSLILIQMFPSILGLVAVYGILSKLTDYVPAIGLGTKIGLILVYLGGSLGGGTYLMYGFFNTIPKELDEAAKIDGATHTQIFYRIILRLVAPVLAVMALLSFIGTFGDYVLASIVFNTNEQYTVAVGLQLLLADPWTKNWAMFAAGAVMSSLPIVIIFVSLQKYITNGLTGGAVKG